VRRLVVDAMNVVGSRPTGWWRDRRAAVIDLVERLQRLVADTGDEVILVLEGRQPDVPEGPHGGIEVVHARRSGPDAADDRIVELVAAEERPGTLHVVSSDRELQRRVRELGARVEGVSGLLRRLES
jgi:predicted RNA-binding protein with PIN domain